MAALIYLPGRTGKPGFFHCGTKAGDEAHAKEYAPLTIIK